MKHHIYALLLYCFLYSVAAVKAVPHFFSFGKAVYTATGIAERSPLVAKCLATSPHLLTGADSWADVFGGYFARLVVGFPWLLIAVAVSLLGMRTLSFTAGLLGGALSAAGAHSRRASSEQPGINPNH